MIPLNSGSVAIIILNYNQWKMTTQCVESVLKSDYKDFRIYLIDNGSKPEEAQLLGKLKGDKVKFKRIEPNRGYVGGMNFGLEWSSADKPDYYLITRILRLRVVR